MKAQVVSYLSGNPSQLIQDNEETLNCKFVLVVQSDELHLVVGPIADFRYHANLLERFCDERQIPSAWVQRPDLLEVVDPETRILGGGHLEINPAKRKMVFHGVSKAYGVFHSREVAEIARQDSFFEGYKATFTKF